MPSLLRLTWLRPLALLAVFLLSSAPSLNRFMAASASGWVQLCTMSGLQQVWHEGSPLPSPHRQDDGDCAYCPLLGAMVGATVLLLTISAQARTPLRQLHVRLPVVFARLRGSLGARGPPASVRIAA